MIKRNLIDIMDLVDDKFITEADPSLPISSGAAHKKFKWSTLILSLFCALLIVNAVVISLLLGNNQQPPVNPDPTPGDKLNQVQNGSNNNQGQNPDTDDSVIVENDALTDVFDKLLAQIKVETLFLKFPFLTFLKKIRF